MSAKTIYMVFGSPSTPEKRDEISRWYEPHLIEMCTLPGVVSAQLFAPSRVQLPNTAVPLPETMALYEFDTDDLAGSFKALWTSMLSSRIAPPAPDAYTLDPGYQSCVYELELEIPEGHGNESPGDGVPARPPARKQLLLCFGSTMPPGRDGQVDRRWWEGALKNVADTPGVVACGMYRPSDVQLPRLVGELPEVLAVCELDSADLSEDVHLLSERQVLAGTHCVDGAAVQGPTDASQKAFIADATFQPAIFELVSQWPRAI